MPLPPPSPQTITIYDLPAVLRDTLPRVATHQNIVKDFAFAGIFPFNPKIFKDMDFAPSYVTDRPFGTPIADEVIQTYNCSGMCEETGIPIDVNADKSTDIDT